MSRRWRSVLLSTASLLAAASAAGAASFAPEPWLSDLAEIRAALTSKYANLEWVALTQRIDLEAGFARAADDIRNAQSPTEARSIIDRLLKRFGDGHLEVDWPGATEATRDHQPPIPICRALGYDAEAMGFNYAYALKMPGLTPVPTTTANEFPGGVIQIAGRRLGLLRIGLFGPQSSPKLCERALEVLAIASNAPCDDACAERVEAWTTDALTDDLGRRLKELKSAGAEVLLVDVSENDGGSNWVEIAARMLTPAPLTSERLGFVRGDHWTSKWSQLATDLRSAAEKASPADKKRLLDWAAQVDQKQQLAAKPCSSEPLWNGRPAGCEWTPLGFYATGIVGRAEPGLAAKPWAGLVFTPDARPHDTGVWSGPLIVLLDQETWSAAEEFSAELQDNGAATLIGLPSGGAGCGHTDGGTPTTLIGSGGVLSVPDCVRLRRDGTNEVGGVRPDELIGLRSADSIWVKAARLKAALPKALRLAGAHR